MQSSSETSRIIYHTLKEFWGFSDFRDAQEEIIQTVISGKDAIVLLPTGGGKSMCYQLPALVMQGACLVISPLLALMKDQVAQLKSMGIEAEYLSSELDELQEEEIYSSCMDGITKLLYISPERMKNSNFIKRVEEIQLSFVAVDEAHCISEWGQDFRPSYQYIKNFREQFAGIPCLALTATATPKVLQDIKQKLGFTDLLVFQKSFRRDNIQIFCDEVGDKYSHVYNLLKHINSSGIVYTRTRREAEQLSAFLQARNMKNVDFFHAGLSGQEKNMRQTQWQKSSNSVLISTNAFGMGIDKDNVRFVIHFSPPASLENYYQEIGRAGRDDEDSYAFLLWNLQELSDLDEAFKNQIPNKTEFLKVVSNLYSTCMVAENELPEKVFEVHLSKIQKFTGTSTAKIKNVLNFLHNQELIYFNTSRTLSSLELKFEVRDLESLPKKDSYFMELLLRSIDGLATHKVQVSEAQLCKKLSVDALQLKERLREIHNKEYIEYLDGSLDSIRFLKPREDRTFSGKWWNLFEQIQKNKLLKWEEMKFYTQNKEFCKMKLILSYFGEKNSDDCGNCYVCTRKDSSTKQRDTESQILEILAQKPSTLDDLAIVLHFHERDLLQEQLIFLLELGKIKMLDFKTYTLQ